MDYMFVQYILKVKIYRGVIISMEILIRAFLRNDYEEICDLVCNELGYDNLNIEDLFKRLDAMQNRKDYQTFVAVQNHKVIGFIGLYKGIAFNLDREYLQIIALAVNKEYQNQGIGTQLLVKAEQYAQNENIVSLGLNSGLHREKAHDFYEKRGYIKKSYCLQKSL
jgi:GNAT superfamily N-acetyltransferase